MDPQIIAILLGATLVLVAIAAVYLWNQVKVVTTRASRLADEKEGLDKRLKELRKEVGSLKPKLNKSKTQAGNRDADVKTYKKKIHDLKNEVKTLRDKAKAESKPADTTTARNLHQLREELMEAMNDGENFRVRAEKAESELERLRDGGQQVEQEPKAKTKGNGESNLQNELEQEIGDTIEKFRGEIRELKQQHRATLKSDKQKLFSEIKELRRNNRQLGHEADQQRRRADNNDRAYKIVQLQLDASLEKLAVVDPDVYAPGGFYDPVVEERLRKEANAKRKKHEAHEAKAAAEKADVERQKAAAEALASLSDEVAPAAEAAPTDEKAEAAAPVADEAAAPVADEAAPAADEAAPAADEVPEVEADKAETTEDNKDSDAPESIDDSDDPLGIGLAMSGDIDEGWSLEGPDIADLLAPKKAQASE